MLFPNMGVVVGLGVWLPASPGADGRVCRVVPGVGVVTTAPGVGAGIGEGTTTTVGCVALGLV